MTKNKSTTTTRAAISQPVRATPSLGEADAPASEIECDQAAPANAVEPAIEDPFGAFSEWDSAADRKAFTHL